MSNKASDAMCAPEKHTPWCPLLEENVKLKARIAELEDRLPNWVSYNCGFAQAIEMATREIDRKYFPRTGLLDDVKKTIKALKPPQEQRE